ncbi:hypothetical protein RU639_010257 [Aspergillus parasiticus]
MLACDPHQWLGMGFSTIDVHDRHVGRHGEGPKPAALVPSRDGCQTALRFLLRGQLYHNGITLTNSTVGNSLLYRRKKGNFTQQLQEACLATPLFSPLCLLAHHHYPSLRPFEGSRRAVVAQSGLSFFALP